MLFATCIGFTNGAPESMKPKSTTRGRKAKTNIVYSDANDAKSAPPVAVPKSKRRVRSGKKKQSDAPQKPNPKRRRNSALRTSFNRTDQNYTVSSVSQNESSINQGLNFTRNAKDSITTAEIKDVNSSTGTLDVAFFKDVHIKENLEERMHTAYEDLAQHLDGGVLRVKDLHHFIHHSLNPSNSTLHTKEHSMIEVMVTQLCEQEGMNDQGMTLHHGFLTRGSPFSTIQSFIQKLHIQRKQLSGGP